MTNQRRTKWMTKGEFLALPGREARMRNWSPEGLEYLIDGPDLNDWDYRVNGPNTREWGRIDLRCGRDHGGLGAHSFSARPAHDEADWRRHLAEVRQCEDLTQARDEWPDEPATPAVNWAEMFADAPTPADLPAPTPIRPPGEVLFTRADGTDVRIVDRWQAYVTRSADRMEKDASDLECPGIDVLKLDDRTLVYKCRSCARLLSTPSQSHHLSCREQKIPGVVSRPMGQTISINTKFGS